MLRACDLRQKEVINICDASRLGYVYDVEIDFSSGYIKSVILPEKGRFFSFFGKSKDRIIPWDKIVRIGEDLVLVQMPDYVDVTAAQENTN
ncbi:MAG: YlmC/YmxH family sporulation protein [Oscillospiraceae bacterium]|nr:YlmC/YmxH family sporulation protein [Oscillospiraceae bacterium]